MRYNIICLYNLTARKKKMKFGKLYQIMKIMKLLILEE